MARDLQKIDSDLASAESTIGTLSGTSSSHAISLTGHGSAITDIKTALSLGTNGQSQRLADLEAGLAKARDKIKFNTYGLYALATNALFVKLDVQLLTFSMQALKVDLSLFKKVDEKNSKKLLELHKWTDEKLAAGRRRVLAVKDFLLKKAALERKTAEAEKKREKEKEDAHEAEQKRQADALRRQVNALPPIVKEHGTRITKIEEALRKARDAAKKAVDSSTGRKHGVDSTKPTVKPVTQDVRALREAVNQLAGALGGI
ncbi:MULTISPECIES: hypothetical protein [unclassified Streptomyces]|uniref:hypothetical protein n=1 Tax=unclassified Streptomyces TaxID=2593676 RepID=UPI000DC7AC53|nr:MULTISPECIES: hypothetical protein [unclassified Streptomyces]AWZ09549.1 hypothetical protein DRB89_39610 [Streptomyces sp. ICC4]AWZ17287.1 hypothetical protein DRB96_39945 [Streptomyces sp. ICC1]